jgi:hypothetical protein
MLAVAYIAVCVIAFGLQRSLLFYPSHASATGPLSAWKERGQVLGYCRELDRPETVWLLMHGNAGQASLALVTTR